MLVECRHCGHKVAIDARHCMSCGTKDFIPRSPAADRFTAIAAVVIVATIGALIYFSVRSEPEPAPAWGSLEQSEQFFLDTCRAAFKLKDPDAVVPDRPVNGSKGDELIGWPYGGDFTFKGRRTSASCSRNQDGSVALTVNGEDLP